MQSEDSFSFLSGPPSSGDPAGTPAPSQSQGRSDTRPWTGTFSAGYADLRSAARRRSRAEPHGGTLSPTALLHEVFLRLSRTPLPIQDSRHLTALCIRIMRQILVDQARHRLVRRKRRPQAPILLDRVASRQPSPEDVLALDEALQQLRRLDPRRADVFALRFYCSLTFDEIAANLGIARSTASEDWRLARAWLSAQLQGNER